MKLSERKKVLLVCMVDSIHVARWISQFSPEEVEFTLFPSTPNRRVHPKIREMIAKNGNVVIIPFKGLISIPLWAVDLFFSNYVRGLILRAALKREQPDYVHALELQHAGYITSRALQDVTIDTKFIATNYGSDIYWFQQFPNHVAKVKRLLARANKYSAECNRDVQLAKKYGFEGDVMKVFPNAGGFSDAQLEMNISKPSIRTQIMVKGYSTWVGQAQVALQAVILLAEHLRHYEIVFYSCNKSFSRKVQRVARNHGMKVRCYLKGSLSHEEVIENFSRSRVYIGVSKSDGISTSLLEAMAFGAFPIQTSTACIDEWYIPGISGFSINKINPEEISEKLKQALSDDQLVDEAASINKYEIKNRLNQRVMREFVHNFYF